MPASKKVGLCFFFVFFQISDRNNIGQVFNKLLKQIGEAEEEFELPDWLNKGKPTPYIFIKRNTYLTKKIKKRVEDDGIFCSCSLSPDSSSSSVCGSNCHCGMLFSSCSSSCKCGTECNNKPFQHRYVKKLKLIQTDKCGSGIVAEEEIQQGEFIIEYVGEVIDDKTCEERLWKMKHRGETNFYLCEINRDMVIDATHKGNKSRYINHSCCPNTQMQKWFVSCHLHCLCMFEQSHNLVVLLLAIRIIDGETRIGIFATCDIKKGEHLTYDYQFVQFGADQDCHCGAIGCRRKLGVKPKPKLPSDEALKVVVSEVAQTLPEVHQNGAIHEHDEGKPWNKLEQGQPCPHNCIGVVLRLSRTRSDRCFCIIRNFDAVTRKHSVMFEDGATEFIDMSKEEDWEILSD
ncbi:unnamed protein product [Brassica rapa]|uniref:Histone-lysine N-methyltransferase ASHH3 n=1 Tax=Brassica campestris TaxID=3711 RepID=A0A8D9G996_BRACM|nr:unnamed protein product [Brassica rapa]